MRSLDWITPSLVAGSFRSLVGKAAGGSFSQLRPDLLNCEVAGPFPQISDELYFPAPCDVVAREDESDDKHLYALRPEVTKPEGVLSSDWGCDLETGIAPALLPPGTSPDFSPAEVPAFWASRQMENWLANPNGDSFAGFPRQHWPASFRAVPSRDDRTHVKIDPTKRAAEDAHLFSTSGMDLDGFLRLDRTEDREMDGLSIRVRPTESLKTFSSPETWSPIGGERRIIMWSAENAGSPDVWQCPRSIQSALNSLQSDSRLIRMVLATPAVFSNGWKPGWLSESEIIGTPPRAKNLKLQLISACVPRWQPISGWEYRRADGSPPGPKKARRMAPAGSVYFFRVADGDPFELTSLWLESICDDEQDRLDGFGLALWGVWAPHSI
jgi:CRISPR-associated protein Cmr3